MSDTKLPVLVISMGDPAGVGPEVVLKALISPEIQGICAPLVVGDVNVMQHAVKTLGLDLHVRTVSSMPHDFTPGVIHVHDLANVDWADLVIGQVSPIAGKAAVEYVTTATTLVQQGQADALVTAPLNKEAMQLAGFHYIGHT